MSRFGFRASRLLTAAALAAGSAMGPALDAVAAPQPAPGTVMPLEPAEDDRRVTVRTRPRPELDPLGIRIGSFLLYPSLGLELEFDDNVYRTDGSEDADLIGHHRPALRFVSDWNNHALEFGVTADAGRYFYNESEDYVDYAVGASGRVDYTRNTNFFGGAQYENLHEDRGTPDGRAGLRPTEFTRATANLGAAHRLNRLTIIGEGRWANLDFDDVAAAGGGRINNDDRDRDEWAGTVRVAYEIVPQYHAFVRGTYNVRDYRRGRDDFGLDRDSHGYEFVVGTDIDLTGITFGTVHVGWREQRYQDDRFDKIGGLTFGGRLTSNVTPITTVELAVDRDIEETSVTAGEGFWATAVRATVDHELLRNLILTGSLAYLNADYRGVNREDDIYRASLGATYLMNRYISIGAGYEFEWRESSGSDSGVDYKSNRAMIRLTGHL